MTNFIAQFITIYDCKINPKGLKVFSNNLFKQSDGKIILLSLKLKFWSM